MTENSELGKMDNTQKVSVSNQINSNLNYSNIKSDSSTLDMDRFNTIPNSRITLQRNQSRKGSQRGGEKKMNSSVDNERDCSILVPNSSLPRAALVGTSTLEKAIVVTVGANTNHPINHQIHHQITITTPVTTAAASTATTESKLWAKRHSFKRSSSSWIVDPRRILFFFATLSSMGTILLIYLTLSMGKPSGDDKILN